MTRAAVLTSVDTPLEIRDDIEVAAPGPGEVRIKVGASGVCHSDLSVLNGTIPMPTPMVLGHEGAGTVLEVGAGVTEVAPGDHVVLSFVPNCRNCYFCNRGQGWMCEKSAMAVMGGLLDGTTRLTSAGAPLHQMAMLGTFGDEAIVPEISMVKIDRSVPLKVAALDRLRGAHRCRRRDEHRVDPRGRHRGRDRLRRRGPQRDPGRTHRRRQRDRRHRHVRLQTRDGPQVRRDPNREGRRGRCRRRHQPPRAAVGWPT